MEEIISCQPCQMEFHQSFLSAHVEAFHVQERQEDIVTLSCSSCSFSVSVRQKNTMAQHCLVSGHSAEEVEVHFNSFLLSERIRIGEIITTSVAILRKNLMTTTKTSTQTKAPERQENEIFNCAATSSQKQSQETETQESSRFETLTFDQIEEVPISPQIKREIILGEIGAKRKKCTDRTQCSKCAKEISASDIHLLRNAVSHVVSHHTDLKLFRCRFCQLQFCRKAQLVTHLKQSHNERFNREEMIGTQQDAERIGNELSICFAQVPPPGRRNIFSCIS